MSLLRPSLLSCLALLAALPSAAQVPAAERQQLETLRRYDARLAGIAQRLVVANAALCADVQPATGLLLHARDQYGAAAAADAVFGFPAPVAVEAVVPGSPAAAAGVAPGDGVAAVNGIALPAEAGAAVSSATRDAALAVLAAQPPAAPLRLRLIRDGAAREAVLPALAGCRIVVEVLPGQTSAAHTDGRVLQIGDGMLARYDDASVAAIVAHELAHVVLRHRIRLDAARAGGGVFRELGRSGRLLARTEREADALSVTLLYNAGYDPAAAPLFWRSHGAEIDPGLFRSRIYKSPAARAAAMDAAIAAIPRDAPRPWTPPLVATRAAPLE